MINKECNLSVVNLRTTKTTCQQTVYNFGICWGYDNTIRNKYCIFKDKTQVYFSLTIINLLHSFIKIKSKLPISVTSAKCKLLFVIKISVT